MNLLIGTNNAGKINEVQALLHDLPVNVVTPLELHLQINPNETGSTYAENALIKARTFFEHAGGVPTITEDAGIDVDALPGELGIHTRRWGLGPSVTDHEWITYFLQRMDGLQNRRATFFSAVAFLDADGKEHLFEGKCAGTITETLETAFPIGLPFEGCFRPDGYSCVYGALTRDEKNRTSHRGKALMGFRHYLLELDVAPMGR